MASAESVVRFTVGQELLRGGDFAQLWGLSPRGEEKSGTWEMAREMKKFLSDREFSASCWEVLVFVA